jgi:hypothetical protein
MAKIYISSTYEDLEKEREAAAEAIRRLGHTTLAMEDYVAADKRPLDKCLEDVRNCDVYIGIFAWRYGDIPDGYDKRDKKVTARNTTFSWIQRNLSNIFFFGVRLYVDRKSSNVHNNTWR